MAEDFQAFISEVRKCSTLGYSKSHCGACEILTDLFNILHQYVKPMEMTAASQRAGSAVGFSDPAYSHG